MTERNSPEYLRQGLDEGRFVIAYTLSDHFQKDLVEQALEEADIPHAVRMSGESEFALIFEDAQGYGTVLVRKEDAERVGQLLDEIRASDAEAAETVREMFDKDSPAEE
ncbi:MAG: hypothetical protein KDA24_16460 [Deltaproteobacteria bacterium]|nr:hypothetical protein [Deltaproteobacteria bacterium]